LFGFVVFTDSSLHITANCSAVMLMLTRFLPITCTCYSPIDGLWYSDCYVVCSF